MSRLTAPVASKLCRSLEQFRRKAKMNYAQGLEAKAVYAAMCDRADFVLPRTYVFDAQARPITAFGRVFDEWTLREIDAAVARAAAAGGLSGYSAAAATFAAVGHGSTVTRRMWRRWPG